uniref:Uncharacterized protein n=1 Tax=Cyprinus carpio carpio TaxID=630221 RepID=A0A8C0Y2L4_CYPCA
MFIVKKCLRARREVCAIMADSRSVAPALPKHSYWFDFWMFLVFDVILFLIVYFCYFSVYELQIWLLFNGHLCAFVIYFFLTFCFTSVLLILELK